MFEDRLWGLSGSHVYSLPRAIIATLSYLARSSEREGGHHPDGRSRVDSNQGRRAVFGELRWKLALQFLHRLPLEGATAEVNRSPIETTTITTNNNNYDNNDDDDNSSNNNMQIFI